MKEKGWATQFGGHSSARLKEGREPEAYPTGKVRGVEQGSNNLALQCIKEKGEMGLVAYYA